MKRKFEYGECSTMPSEEKGTLKIRKQVEKSKAAEEKVKIKVKNEEAEERGNLVKREVEIEAAEDIGNLVKSEVKIEAAEERVMCGIWTLPMVIFLIKMLDNVRTKKARKSNLRFVQLDWEKISKAINRKKFKCATSGECQQCGKYAALIPSQVQYKYYQMMRGCKDLIEILDNPEYEMDHKRWKKICSCTQTKSVARSSARALTADSAGSSCAIPPNSSLDVGESDGLMTIVWKVMEAMDLEVDPKMRAITLLHQMDEKMMKVFLGLSQIDQRLYVLHYKCND